MTSDKNGSIIRWAKLSNIKENFALDQPPAVIGRQIVKRRVQQSVSTIGGRGMASPIAPVTGVGTELRERASYSACSQ